jgi:hypothetical protein
MWICYLPARRVEIYETKIMGWGRRSRQGICHVRSKWLTNICKTWATYSDFVSAFFSDNAGLHTDQLGSNTGSYLVCEIWADQDNIRLDLD